MKRKTRSAQIEPQFCHTAGLCVIIVLPAVIQKTLLEINFQSMLRHCDILKFAKQTKRFPARLILVLSLTANAYNTIQHKIEHNVIPMESNKGVYRVECRHLLSCVLSKRVILLNWNKVHMVGIILQSSLYSFVDGKLLIKKKIGSL